MTYWHTFSIISLLAIRPAYPGENPFTSSDKSGLFDNPSASQWSLSAGPTWRQTGTLKLKGGNNSEGFAIPSLFAPNSTNDPAIGEAGEFGDRDYDNGYVNQSPLTANTGFTTFWGYSNSDQINNNNIAFSSTGIRTAVNDALTQQSRYYHEEETSNFSPQFDLQYSPKNTAWGISHFLISFSIGSSDESTSFSNFGGSQSEDTYRRVFTDTYPLGELAVNPNLIPAPGYNGTFGGPGPLLANLPDNRSLSESLIGTETISFQNSIRTSTEITSISLAIGPVFEGKLKNDFRWQFACGSTFTFYDWKTSQSETLAVSGPNGRNLASFNSQDSGSEFGLGLFARASIVYDFDENWFATSFLQGEVGNSFDMQAGPSRYEYEPNGYSLGLTVGRRF